MKIRGGKVTLLPLRKDPHTGGRTWVAPIAFTFLLVCVALSVWMLAYIGVSKSNEDERHVAEASYDAVLFLFLAAMAALWAWMFFSRGVKLGAIIMVMTTVACVWQATAQSVSSPGYYQVTLSYRLCESGDPVIPPSIPDYSADCAPVRMPPDSIYLISGEDDAVGGYEIAASMTLEVRDDRGPYDIRITDQPGAEYPTPPVLVVEDDAYPARQVEFNDGRRQWQVRLPDVVSDMNATVYFFNMDEPIGHSTGTPGGGT